MHQSSHRLAYAFRHRDKFLKISILILKIFQKTRPKFWGKGIRRVKSGLALNRGALNRGFTVYTTFRIELYTIKLMSELFSAAMSKAELKIAMYGTIGLGVVWAGGLAYCMPFLKRMMTCNPIHFMNQDKVADLRKDIVYTDIPIPNDPEEEFETDILIEWYNDQKGKGLVQ